LGTGKLSITELAQDVGNESEISVGIERAAHTVTVGMQQLVVAKKSTLTNSSLRSTAPQTRNPCFKRLIRF